jgi:prevent-host-death family protein
MKQISVQQLKATLSTAIAEAESGQVLEITRHNQPVARLGPGSPPEVRRGARVGAGRLRPAIHRGSKGRYLALLLEDRGNR